MRDRLRISAPGRICLFGEHQDYLGLPVVAVAVDMRLVFDGKRANLSEFRIDLPDTNETQDIPLGNPIRYEGKRDYLRSVLKVLKEEGFSFADGWDVTLRGDIPIGKGCSSSSAMVVAWAALLAMVSEREEWLAAERAARRAHRAEVSEFGEPGGMMDHFAAAVGGMILVKPGVDAGVESLGDPPECAFVLGDSGETKATTFVLANVKERVREGLSRLREHIADFNIVTVTAEDARRALANAPDTVRRAVLGNLRNREITREGLNLLKSEKPDTAALGALLSEQHAILRDALGISTPRVEALIVAAMSAGALGTKINGSGGGGCMFAACAPEDAPRVAAAMEKAGGAARTLRVDEGVRNEEL